MYSNILKKCYKKLFVEVDIVSSIFARNNCLGVDSTRKDLQFKLHPDMQKRQL